MTDWLNPNPAAEVTAPRLNDPLRRSPSELTAVVAQFEVETAERYRRRDIDNDGDLETWCNRFAVDVCRAMGAPIPYRRCNDLHPWFVILGEDEGWERVGHRAARALAGELGRPVVAIWRNPKGEHGHIAVLVPHSSGPLSASRTYVAQAGGTNRVCMPIETAFGDKKPLFFAHE